jgi:hypothetical protein
MACADRFRPLIQAAESRTELEKVMLSALIDKHHPEHTKGNALLWICIARLDMLCLHGGTRNPWLSWL